MNALASTTKLGNNAGSSLDPNLAAVGNNVYVVWQNIKPENYDTEYTTILNLRLFTLRSHVT